MKIDKMAQRIIEVEGEKYILQKTTPFSTSYGRAGSKGYRVIRKRDGYSFGQYKSVAEFRAERKRVKR